MGWLIDIAIEWFWIGLVERMSKGKPWWIWAFWALSPLLALAALLAMLWLLVRLLPG